MLTIEDVILYIIIVWPLAGVVLWIIFGKALGYNPTNKEEDDGSQRPF